MTKRTFDIVCSGLGLVLLAPLFVVIAVWIKLDSRGPIFFRQIRVGRFGKTFKIYKFRTMVAGAESKGRQITAGDDSRITRAGRILRKHKLDELPQLINVLKGEMSLVGPRPEVPKYVEMFKENYQVILGVTPGITDFASLKFRQESALLHTANDPESLYIREILPEKIRLAKEYVANASLLLDIKVILMTLLHLPSR